MHQVVGGGHSDQGLWPGGAQHLHLPGVTQPGRRGLVGIGLCRVHCSVPSVQCAELCTHYYTEQLTVQAKLEIINFEEENKLKGMDLKDLLEPPNKLCV